MAKRKVDPKETPGNDTVLRKEPCPKCGSKDNLVRYADGHAHCFSQGCDHWEPSGSESAGEPREGMEEHGSGPSSEFLKPDDAGWEPSRRKPLQPDTIRKFGHFSTGHGGKRVGVYPYYVDGQLAFQKVKTPEKDFFVIKAAGGDLTKAWPYGRQIWGDRHDRKVVIFTGEDDAEAAAEVTRFKFPCVSVPTGDGGAKKHLQANYKWYDRFAEIIFFFDNDESGQAIIPECAELFDPAKVKVAKMSDFKDAAEAKKANRPGDIEAAIYAASLWGPQGVVNARDGLEKFLEEGLIVPSWPYPWSDLEALTLGMRRGEITLHIGGTGIAKTTLLYHYAQHLLRWRGDCPSGRDHSAGWLPEQHPVKIGWLGFEDTLRTVKVGIISIHAGQRIHIEPLSEEQTRRAYLECFGEGQLEVYDPETAEWGVKPVMAMIKFMVKALGCSVLFIDPLSFLVSMMGTSDRTQGEEKLAGEMAYLVKHLNCHFHISHHLKKADGTPFEEGGEVSLQDAKGAGAWYQYASNVFAYERDQQGPRPDLLRMRLLKVRWVGQTGVLPHLLRYDMKTGRYTPTDDRWPDPKAKNKENADSGFRGEY